MDGQIDKLDFLMQSLIKMSRLETGTFTLHMEEARLSDTIAQAMSTVWAKAEAKGSTCRRSATAPSRCSTTPSGRRRPSAISWTMP